MNKRINLIAMLVGLASFLTAQQQASIKIKSPKNGTIVRPGEQLKVVVEASLSLKSVIVGGDGDLGIALPTEDPTQFSLAIPKSLELRKYSIFATGKAQAGADLEAEDDVAIDVEREDTPLELNVELEFLRFTKLGEKSQLVVRGTFKDGAEFSMTRSSRIRYQSGNPAVATVNESGMVTSVAPGKTHILVTAISTVKDQVGPAMAVDVEVENDAPK